jgi:ubiquinone biosynthesis protein
VRLFEVGRRFGMAVQPQLTLLMKTMLQVEGLGRQLDPDLDLRRIAQPILERFVSEQMGMRGFLKQVSAEAPLWAQALPQIPRLVHRMLTDDAPRRLERAIRDLERAQARQTRMLAVIAAVLAALVVGILVRAATG